MTKLLNALIVLLAAALVFVIIYPQIQQNRPIPMRFACDSSAASLPVLVGVDESLFVQEKILPSIQFYSDPDQALNDLFAGKYDVGIFPWTSIIRHAAEKGETLKVLLSLEYRQSLPVDAVIAPLKSRVATLADIRGKRFGYPPQLRDCVPILLLNLGMSVTDVQLSEVSLGEMMARLDAGELDAAWVLEPLLCSVDSTRYRTVQTSAAARYVSQPFPGAALGIAPKLLKQYRLAGGRLKVSTDRAVAGSETKAERAREIIGRYLSYCATRCGFCRLPEMQRLAEINRSAVAALAARMRTAGVLKTDVDTKPIFVDPATLKR